MATTGETATNDEVDSLDVERRLREWAKLLGISENSATGECTPLFDSCISSNGGTELSSSKLRIITQDVLRTRADEPFFSMAATRGLLRQSLERYCLFYNVHYMQGLNEVLAPLLSLSPIYAAFYRAHNGERDELAQEVFSAAEFDDGFSQGGIYIHFGMSLQIFEKLMQRLLLPVYKTKHLKALQIQLINLHLLLTYHDPLLAFILRKEGMLPEMYAMPWFITLFARRLPLAAALHLWDILLLHHVTKPHMVVFLATALIMSNRDIILQDLSEDLPKIMVPMQFHSIKHVNHCFEIAQILESNTPFEIIEELNTYGFSTQPSDDIRRRMYDALQHRPCLLLQPSVLATAIAERKRCRRCESISSSRGLHMLILDCRRSPDTDQEHCNGTSNGSATVPIIEGTLTIPPTVQDELCALAKLKSAILDRSNETRDTSPIPAPEHWVGNSGDNADQQREMAIEQRFAMALSSLSTAASTLLSLLWVAFRTHSPETIHLVVADDSVESYGKILETDVTLATCYTLPPLDTESYHGLNSHLLPGTITTTTGSSNDAWSDAKQRRSSGAFASALIILGFPRVSLLQFEEHEDDANDDVFHLPINSLGKYGSGHRSLMADEKNESQLHTTSAAASYRNIRRSGFASLMYHLHMAGINSYTFTPLETESSHSKRRSHRVMQVPVNYFIEYQMLAFLFEMLRTTSEYSQGNRGSMSTNVSSLQLARLQHSSLAPIPVPDATVDQSPVDQDKMQGETKPSSIDFESNVVVSEPSPPHTTSITDIRTMYRDMSSCSSPPVSRPSSFRINESLMDLSIRTAATDECMPQLSYAAEDITVPFRRPGRRSLTSLSFGRSRFCCDLGSVFQILRIMSDDKKEAIAHTLYTDHFHSHMPFLSRWMDAGSDLKRESGGDRLSSRFYLERQDLPGDDIDLQYYHKLMALFVMRGTTLSLNRMRRPDNTIEKLRSKLVDKSRILSDALHQSKTLSKRSVQKMRARILLRSEINKHSNSDSVRGLSRETQKMDNDHQHNTVQLRAAMRDLVD